MKRRSLRWSRGLVGLLLSILCVACAGVAQGSIGAVLSHDRTTGALTVVEAPPGLGAEAAGLYPGDRVKMIDGFLVDDLDPRAIQARLRGDVGTEVTLTVVRGDEVLHLEIERGPFADPAPQPRTTRIE